MRHSPLLNRNESTYSSIPLRYISLMWHSPLLNRNESTYSSIPLRYISLMRHSSLLNRNESTYSSIPLRYISLMRHSPHHQKGTGSFWKQAFSRTCSFFGVCGLIAYAQKKHHPRSCTTETVPANARSGARTLDTLIKSQVLFQLS